MSAPLPEADQALVLLLDEGAELPVREIAGPLARLLGRVRYDLAQALRANPYVPFSMLSRKQADEAVRALAGFGLEAVAAPASEVPGRPELFAGRAAEPREDCLLLRLEGRERELPWDEVAALGAATLAETVRSTRPGPSVASRVVRAGTGLYTAPLDGTMQPRTLPGVLPSDHATEQSAFLVLSVLPLSAEVEFRLRMDELRYDFLGERRAPNAFANFRTLAGEMAARAGRARLGAEIAPLVEKGVRPPARDQDAFWRRNAWLKFRARAGV